jgi:predicted nucleotidyltransferase
MRKSTVLGALFPRIRQGVLAATLTQPEKWWYLSELAQFLHTTPSSLQREVASLAASGILRRRREGTRVYCQAETRSPVFSELRHLMEKTVGLVPTVRQALEPLAARIACAFIYGSVARSQERAVSDVDLMVIGSAGLADLSPVLRKVEARLGREINPVTYSTGEFSEKLASKDHFLMTVLREPKHFVKGSQHDLDRITG